MIENPLLEDEAQQTQSSEDAKMAADVADVGPPTQGAEATQESEKSGQEAVNEIDWDAYLENYSSPLPAGGVGGDDLPGPEQTLTESQNLTAHLLEQLGVAECSVEERAIAEVIIGNLDEAGFLREITLEELATSIEVDLELAEEALMLVQEFDPIGVGSRSLAECLLTQARIQYPGDVVVRNVLGHLGDLERKDYSCIARAIDATKIEVIDAHRRIMTLEPRPARQWEGDDTSYITPDIYIVKRGDDWVPMLNDDGLPRLRVSDYYRRALKGSDQAEAKSYVQERLRSAVWLIRSIEQRQRTIVRVTDSIIRFQREFFDRGIDHLRPLVLREVADDIGMHESTISRVTTNKYVHTSRGIYELKFFFNSSIRKEDGVDIAAEAVKQRIKKIVEAENRRKPFSDQKLVQVLSDDHGIEIARRTVAKYREMLGILSSSKRKQLI
jgi:RNA polymerase sigma-54 factor